MARLTAAIAKEAGATRSLLFNAASTLAFRLASVAIGALSSIVLARSLSLGEMGQYSLFALFVAVVGALFGSGYTGVAYLISRERVVPARALLSAVPLVLLGGASSIAAALALREAAGIHAGVALAILTGLGLSAFILQTYFQGLYLAISDITAHNLAQYGPQYLFLALLLLGASVHRLSLAWALTAWAVAYLANATRVAVLPRVTLSGGLVNLSWDATRTIIHFNALLATGTLLGIAASRANFVTLSSHRGIEAVAFYSIPLLVAESLYHIPMSLAVASYRALGVLPRQDSAEVTARLIRSSLSGITLLALSGVALAGLMPMIFGHRYEPAVSVLRILLLGIPFYGCKDLFATFFLNQEARPSLVAGNQALAAIANVVLGAVLVSSKGPEGAAWSYVSAALLSFGGFALAFVRITGLSLTKLLIPRLTDVGQISDITLTTRNTKSP